MTLSDVVDAIARRRPMSSTHTFVVAIDGGGGAGKSTFADALAERLDAAPVVRTDDFATWDNPLGWAPRFASLVLQPASRGDTLHYRRSDWETRALGAWVHVAPHRYLVIEGVGSTQLSFAPLISYSIWIDTPREVRLRRGLERDGSHMREQWTQWMAEEDHYFALEDPQRRADAVVSGDDRWM